MVWWPTAVEPGELLAAREAAGRFAQSRRRLARRLCLLAVALVVVGVVAGTMWNVGHGSPTESRASVANVETTRQGRALVVLATVNGDPTTFVIPAPGRCGCWRRGDHLSIWYDDARPPHVWTHDPAEPGFAILMLGLPAAGVVSFLLSLADRRTARFVATALGGAPRRYRARWWTRVRRNALIRCVTLEDVDTPGVVVTSGRVRRRAGFHPETVVAFGDPAGRLVLVDAAGNAATMSSRGPAFDAQQRPASPVELGIRDNDGNATIPLTTGDATALVAYRALVALAMFVAMPFLALLRLVGDRAPLGPVLVLGIGLVAFVLGTLVFRAVLVRRIARRLGAPQLTAAAKTGIRGALTGPMFRAAREELGPPRAARVTAAVVVPVGAVLLVAAGVLLLA